MPSSPFSILNIRYDTMTFHKKSVKKTIKPSKVLGLGKLAKRLR
jgi:hypothetical protein